MVVNNKRKSFLLATSWVQVGVLCDCVTGEYI